MEGTIQANKHGVRVCFIVSLIPILAGGAIIVLGVPEVQKFVFKGPLLPNVGKFLPILYGALVTSVTSLPFKGIQARKDRIRYLESLKNRLIIVEKNPQKNLNEIKKLKTRIWDYCEKISL